MEEGDHTPVRIETTTCRSGAGWRSNRAHPFLQAGALLSVDVPAVPMLPRVSSREATHPCQHTDLRFPRGLAHPARPVGTPSGLQELPSSASPDLTCDRHRTDTPDSLELADQDGEPPAPLATQRRAR